jgi:NADH dehydrogenase FAD-containing subunit
MLFTSLLTEAASGTVEPRHVVVPVSGLAEHGLGFKDLADAIALRNRVLLQLERASIHPDDPSELGFVFGGAGYAGVEALAELHDMAHAALRFYPALRGIPQRWVLVDAAPKILPEIPRRLGEYAARRLARRGIEIHIGTTLESYDGAEAALADGTRGARAHARVDCRRTRQSAPRRARSSPRRTRARDGRRRPARGGHRQRVGARRQRRRP